MLELYRNIKRIREEKGMSQDELARLVGFKSRSSINKIEMGVNDITQSKLIAIANALHVSPGELMGEDKEVASPADLSSRLPNMVSIEARTFRVPIVGRVAAGRPIVVDEEIIGYEYIDNNIPRMVTNTSVCVSSASLWSLPYIPVRFLVAAHGIR